MRLEYTKMHGTQNTMTMINNMDGQISLTSEQVAQICTELETDGLILIESRPEVDCYMNYYNADGSFGEMCGNGIRCLAKFFIETTNSNKTTLQIGTAAGTKQIDIQNGLYTVNMGPVRLEGITEIEGLKLHKANIGNPHAITFMEDIDSFDLETVGPKIETNPEFPNKTNFEIIEVLGPNELKLRVWERGSGITQACGTGAAASFFVAKELGLIEGPTTIQLPGGPLQFEETEKGEILMTGPAENITTGYVDVR